MVDNVPPSIDPADSEDLAGAFRQILGKFLAQSIDDMLPARVISFDSGRNEARIQPLIMIKDTDGNFHSRAQFTVPVFTLGGGNALVRFNLNQGDLGWIQANDRDISLFIQSLEEAGPNTNRKHQFEDAVFFPDVLRNFTPVENDASMVIQTTNGNVFLSVADTGFKMKGDLSVEGGITTTGDVVANGVSLETHTHNFTNADGAPSVTETPN